MEELVLGKTVWFQSLKVYPFRGAAARTKLPSTPFSSSLLSPFCCQIVKLFKKDKTSETNWAQPPPFLQKSAALLGSALIQIDWQIPWGHKAGKQHCFDDWQTCILLSNLTKVNKIIALPLNISLSLISSLHRLLSVTFPTFHRLFCSWTKGELNCYAVIWCLNKLLQV